MGNTEITEDDNLCSGLDPKQRKSYHELMAMPLADWPEELREFVARVAKYHGMEVEDVACCAVIDWLRRTSTLTRVPLKS